MHPYYWSVVLNTSFAVFFISSRSALFFTETTFFVTKGQAVSALNFVLITSTIQVSS